MNIFLLCATHQQCRFRFQSPARAPRPSVTPWLSDISGRFPPGSRLLQRRSLQPGAVPRSGRPETNCDWHCRTASGCQCQWVRGFAPSPTPLARASRQPLRCSPASPLAQLMIPSEPLPLVAAAAPGGLPWQVPPPAASCRWWLAVRLNWLSRQSLYRFQLRLRKLQVQDEAWFYAIQTHLEDWDSDVTVHSGCATSIIQHKNLE